MIKKLLLGIIIVLPTLLSSQWKFGEQKNHFDGMVRLAYVVGKGGTFPYDTPILAIKSVAKEKYSIILTKIGYTGCDDNRLRISFGKDEVYDAYDVQESITNDALYIEKVDGLSDIEFIGLLKSEKSMFIRHINDCSHSDFEFTLSGSTKAIEKALQGIVIDGVLSIQDEKATITELENYYKNLTCDDLLDTINPMYTDYLLRSTEMFETDKGMMSLDKGTVVMISNSNRTTKKIKVKTTIGESSDNFHMTPKEAKKLIVRQNIIDTMNKGLKDFWNRMDHCE